MAKPIPPEEDVFLSVRITKELAEKLDRKKNQIASERKGFYISRSDVIREFLETLP